jgi:hypothetical protein
MNQHRSHDSRDLKSTPQLLRTTRAARTRTQVDYEILKNIANTELSRIPECAGYAVGIVAHLPDETGCNWDIKVTHKGVDRRGAPLLREAVLLLRGRYNLRPANVR